MIQKIKIFLEMIKFEHSIFALPFAFLGLLLASPAWPGGRTWFWVSLAMVSFRTMAMGFNRLIDRYIDAKNPRTKDRALPQGLLSGSLAWQISFFSLILFEVSSYQLNAVCLKLSFIPVLLAFLYPWMKRFTWSSHAVLGIILSIAPYGAWLAVRPEFSWIPGLISLGIAFWVMGFDILYALQDFEFDRQEGLFSIPARWGVEASLVTSRICHVLTMLCWVGAGKLAGLGIVFFAGIFISAALMGLEHWLVAHHGLKKIDKAFFDLNAWISVIIFTAYLIEKIWGF